ncbi:Anp1-domain-containing protein [Scheffersomyces xylosifermentans]|uniref:Anp1-domain-containing protein n=1 Tax=Scheffersomyces xylosifermentans TaxID=1304137 RepID=UPI00315CEBE6
MVLDSYGSKPQLPIFNRLTPRKLNSRGLVKRIALLIVSLVVIYTLFIRNFFFSSSIVSHSAADDNYEFYQATKDGITKQDTSANQNDIDLAAINDQNIQQRSDDTFAEKVEYYDLNDYRGSADGKNQGDVVLFLMPLRNAENVLPMAFYNLMNLTYDHSLIDIAFLVSDCSPDDRTLETVFEYSIALQNGTLVDKLQQEEQEKRTQNVRGSSDLYQLYMDKSYMDGVKKAYSHPETHHKNYRQPFRSVSIFKKDFGQIIGQGFSDRHAVKVQGIRRKLMGRARNWLTSSALKPYHSWVYWRDVDIETCPGDVIEELMQHDYDVMVPNVWRPLPTFLGNEQPYDLNSWIESDPALELAKGLDEDDVIVEGYAEYPTWRAHLAYIRDPNGNAKEVVDLDGVGGVSILARAQIFRQGVHFPAFTFLNHAETEAFGKMAKKMGFKVGGLPHYTIWHIYEPSEDDLKKIAKLERKKRRKGRTKE